MSLTGVPIIWFVLLFGFMTHHSGNKDEEPPCGRKLRKQPVGKEGVIEHTPGDTTGRER